MGIPYSNCRKSNTKKNKPYYNGIKKKKKNCTVSHQKPWKKEERTVGYTEC